MTLRINLCVRNLASPIISPRTELMNDMQNRFNIDNEGPNKKIKTEMDVDTDGAPDVPLGLLEMFNTLEVGRVLCVGQGSTGQLGNGPDMIERKKPFPVKDLADVDVKIIPGMMILRTLNFYPRN